MDDIHNTIIAAPDLVAAANWAIQAIEKSATPKQLQAMRETGEIGLKKVAWECDVENL